MTSAILNGGESETKSALQGKQHCDPLVMSVMSSRQGYMCPVSVIVYLSFFFQFSDEFYNILGSGAGGMRQLERCLLSKYEDLSLNLQHTCTKPGRAARIPVT